MNIYNTSKERQPYFSLNVSNEKSNEPFQSNIHSILFFCNFLGLLSLKICIDIILNLQSLKNVLICNANSFLIV